LCRRAQGETLLAEMGLGSRGAVVENAAHGDKYGRVLRANQELADLLGAQREALVGTELRQHLHADDSAVVQSALLGLLSHTGTLFDGSVRLVATDGRSVRVHAFASVITMTTGTAILLRVLATAQ
jgi:PAS domain S-box-containing protein